MKEKMDYYNIMDYYSIGFAPGEKDLMNRVFAFSGNLPSSLTEYANGRDFIHVHWSDMSRFMWFLYTDGPQDLAELADTIAGTLLIEEMWPSINDKFVAFDTALETYVHVERNDDLFWKEAMKSAYYDNQ